MPLFSSADYASLWLSTSQQPTYPPLAPQLEVDVAILGGGLAGISCAYFLTQAGKSVAVLEANRIGQGVTGHTTAHITSEHNFITKEIQKAYGEDKARLYAQANETAIQTIAEVVKKERIECQFTRVKQYLMCENKQDLPKLREEFELAQQFGLPVTYHDSAPVPFPTYGAIAYHEQAQFHPQKYLLALADRVQERGGYIFEHTRALDVTDGDPFTIETDQGALKAQDVIVATHFPFLDRGGYFARMKPLRSYVLALRVEDEFPHDMFDNTANPYNYIRTYTTEKETLLLVGGEDHETGHVTDTKQCYQNLEKYARERFTVKEIKYFWSTQDNYPYDKVPFIGKLLPTTDHLFVATGFQGYGMTHSTIAGLLLRDHILGKENRWEEVYTPSRLNLERGIVKTIMANLHIGKTFLKGRLDQADHEKLSQLPLGTAKILEVKGEKLAVYKDEQGKVHAVSAICQHMGCVVAFNTAETSWDCPCHGSRYSVSGEVLHGPTTKGLSRP